MRAITPNDLYWFTSPTPGPSSLVCAICHKRGDHVAVLQVASMAPPNQPLRLFRCAKCGSGFYDPPDVRSFADLGQQGDDFWRLYGEVGGGVWETIWPVLVDVAPHPRSLRDVGCGFGFLVDYWRRATGAEALGIELADYGAVGALQLGMTVHRQLLEECTPLASRRFDIVHASEVIEHVPDPAAFLRTLASYVADDGVLVLTTPCMDFVLPEDTSATLLAALAPGFHGFLLSPQALEDAARAAGFAHVTMRSFGERQMLRAPRISRMLDFGSKRARASYLEYLEDWFKQSEPSTPLWQGYAYRYVRDLVNAGRFADAKTRAGRLVDALRGVYGPSIVEPDAMTLTVRSCDSLVEVGRVAPYFLPCLHFLLGSLAEHADNDRVAARRYSWGAAAIGIECVRFGSVFFLEAAALIWPARARGADIALAQGEFSEAMPVFERLARDGRRCMAADGYAIASDELIESQTQRACQELVKRGAWIYAHNLLEALLAGLHDRCPEVDWTAAETMARLFEQNVPGGPRDTVFAFFVRDLLDAASLSHAASYTRLRTLLDLAASRHETTGHGALVANYAAVVRRLWPELDAASDAAH